MDQDRPARDGLNLRLPRGLRDRIKAAATSNHRTMNAEVAFHLENIFGASASGNDDGAQIGTLSPSSSTSDPVGSRSLITERPLEGHP